MTVAENSKYWNKLIYWGKPVWSVLIKVFRKKVFGVPLIIGIAVGVLYCITVPVKFSSEITSKELNIELDNIPEQNIIKITVHPVLQTLTVLADNIRIATSEFVIWQTNKPEFKGIKTAHALEAKTIDSTYYRIQSIGSIPIPTILLFQPHSQTEERRINIKFQFKESMDGHANKLSIQLPAGKATLDLSTKVTDITIEDKSQVKYGMQTVNTDGKQISITGPTDKIKVDLKTSEVAELILLSDKGQTYEIDIEMSTPELIRKLQFIQVSPKSTIYLEGMEQLYIKDKFPTNPTITVLGIEELEEVPKFHVTDQGINTNLQDGKCQRIKIAHIVKKRRALNSLMNGFGSAWTKIKEII